MPTLEKLWPYGYVAPVRERGLKILRLLKSRLILPVAPVRGRGLKLVITKLSAIVLLSRSREGAWIEMYW